MIETISDEQLDRNLVLPARSPRSAAIAGIAFSLLTAASMLMIMSVVNSAPPEMSVVYFASRSRTVSIAVGLVPFAGIAFLWFTGVIRDHLGSREDQFFATVFLGSGLVFLAMIFVWAATVGAMFGVLTAAADDLASNDIFVYGFQFTRQIIGSYALRMAGVYMLSIGTIWMRTAVMPRWLTIITYVVALGFIFLAGSFRELRLIFPAWVLLVSVYILIVSRRLDPQNDE